jgi:hypothetical protein
MNITLVIPDETVEKIVRAIMDNHPEAGMTLKCRGWDYKKMEFEFVDTEDGKTYDLDKAKLIAAFPLLFDPTKWPKGLTQPPFSANWEDWDNWLCQSDAFDFDAFAQLAAFGEVIYG